MKKTRRPKPSRTKPPGAFFLYPTAAEAQLIAEAAEKAHMSISRFGIEGAKLLARVHEQTNSQKLDTAARIAAEPKPVEISPPKINAKEKQT